MLSRVEPRVRVTWVLLLALDVIFVLVLRHTHDKLVSLALVVPPWVLLLWWCRRSARGLRVGAMMIMSGVLLVPFVWSWSLTSDDVYRYVWDGRVQLAGIDPYRYVPLDRAVAFLRDPFLFPPELATGKITHINRPTVPTIYPPVAQLIFTAVAALTPWSVGPLGIKIVMSAAVVITTGVLARVRSDRPEVAMIYGSSPLIMLEAGNGGHVDAVAALLIALTMIMVAREKLVRAGLLLGLAAGVKLVPLLLLPALWRGGRWRTSVTAVGVLLASYVPHVLAVGALVLGFLPGYLAEEGYDDGRTRFALLGFLPADVRAPVAVVLAAVVAVVVLVRSPRAPVAVSCVTLYGLAFCLSTTIYAWYALPLVVLAILARRPEWFAVWAASYLAFVFDRNLVVQGLGYAAALAVVAVATWRRSRGAAIDTLDVAGRRPSSHEL